MNTEYATGAKYKDFAEWAERTGWKKATGFGYVKHHQGNISKVLRWVQSITEVEARELTIVSQGDTYGGWLNQLISDAKRKRLRLTYV